MTSFAHRCKRIFQIDEINSPPPLFSRLDCGRADHHEESSPGVPELPSHGRRPCLTRIHHKVSQGDRINHLILLILNQFRLNDRRYVAGMKQRYTQSSGRRPFGMSCLLTGFDDDGTPHLYQVCSLGGSSNGVEFRFNYSSVHKANRHSNRPLLIIVRAESQRSGLTLSKYCRSIKA